MLSFILVLVLPISSAFPQKNIYLKFTRIDAFKGNVPGSILDASLRLIQSDRVYNFIFEFEKIYKLEVEEDLTFEVFLYNSVSIIYLFKYLPNSKSDSLINFSLPSVYNVLNSAVLCPKCDKSDMTFAKNQAYYRYEIESGNETTVKITTDSTKGEKMYSGSYYCERDAINF